MKTFFKVLFMSLGILLFACNKPCPPPVDPRTELSDMVKDSTAKDFLFAMSENTNESSSTLTNPGLHEVIDLSKAALPMVLRYSGIRDKKANSTTYYKTELVKKENGFSIVATDLSGGKVVWEKIINAQAGGLDTLAGLPDSGFNSINDCIADWNCRYRGQLQCEANRTCENQYGAMICCLKNGLCFSIHVVVPPTSWRCRLKDLIPDLDGMVLQHRQ